jgi:protein-disulfide isomerase
MAATDAQRPAVLPAGVSPEGDAIVLGAGPITVDAYIDFQCPFCRMFEERSGQTLDRLVADGLVNLAYHPLRFLDRLSTTRYSSRAASASGCASDYDRFAPYKDSLFANQPPEGGPGLSDAELIELGRRVGIADAGFARCVAEHVYAPWVAYVTDRAIARGITGTPSVLVAGRSVPANPELIVLAVVEAAGA